MNHLRFHRILPASACSLALVAATMTGGCNDEPSAQLATDVTTTLERTSGGPDSAPLASGNDPLPPAEVQPASDTADTAALPPSFTQAQLESMVAPIALYPDPLLMQILMAATYPAEVVQAAAWVKDNPGLNGKALDDAIADKRWDVSVNSLTHAPKALELLAADTKWMQDLGDAFLAQQDDVLNAVQVMRVKACDLGNLKTTDQQKVVIEERQAEPAPADSYVVPPPSRVVRIEPVQPEVVYVPQYNPQLVYGYAPPTYYYPTIYSYPYFTAIAAPVITFGVGLAIGGFLWGDCDWHHHHVYARPYYRDYYVGRYWWNGRYGGYNDFYRSGYARDYHWRHDIDHRRGVRYVNRDVDRFYSVRGRDPYRFRDDNYRYDRRKAARGDYDRMPGFRDSREASRDGSRDAFRDGSRDGDRDGSRDGSRDGGRGDSRDGDSRDWRDKAREDARERMNRDSQARGERGPGSGGGSTREGDRGGMRDGDRGGNRAGSGKDSARDSALDRGGDGKGPSADRGGAKGPSVDRGGDKGSSGDRGKVDRPSGGGGGRSGDRGPSVKQGGGSSSKGSSSQRGGGSSPKGGSVERGGSSKGGSSKGGSVQRGGGSSQRGGGSSKGSSVQRGGSGGGGRPGGGSSMRQGGGGSPRGGSVQRGGGGSSQRGGGSSQRSGGGSQGGRSGGSSKGGGGGDRGKGGGRN